MNTQKTVTISRIQYWDIAKGLAIMLTVLGHTDLPPVIRAVIFSFHMPFFIIANGFFIKAYDVKKVFLKSVKTLLLPYFVTCFISACIYAFLGKENCSATALFGVKIKAMIGGMSKISTKFQDFDSVWVVWFICSLFITRNLYVLIMCLFKQKKYLRISFICGLTILGYLVEKYYAFMPWSLDVALITLPFIAFGDWLHKGEFFNKSIIYTGFLPFLIWFSILFCTRSHIELAMRSYPNGIFAFISAIAGSLVLIEFSKQLVPFDKLSAILSWIGQNSMIILCLHCIEMMYFNWNKLAAFIPLNWVTLFLTKSVVLLICTWLIRFFLDNTINKHYVRKEVTP